MEAQIERLEGTCLRKVEVASWDSAVAKQHGINRLPTLWLYEGGKRVSTDTNDVLRKLAGR